MVASFAHLEHAVQLPPNHGMQQPVFIAPNHGMQQPVFIALNHGMQQPVFSMRNPTKCLLVINNFIVQIMDYFINCP